MPTPPRRNRTQAPLRPRRRPWLLLKASLALFTLLLLASTWSFTFSRLKHEEHLVIEHAKVSQQNLAHIIAENLHQVLDRGALYALLVSEWLSGDQASAKLNLSAMLTGDRAYNRIAVYDPRGRLLHSTSPAVEHDDVASSVRTIIAGDQGDASAVMHVGPLSRDYGQSWQVPLLMPLSDAGGTLLGVLVLHLDLGYLLQLYQDIDIGQSGIIQILESHGRELARARRGGLEISEQGLVSNPLPADNRAQGSWISPLQQDTPFLICFHRLTNYPFVVTVDKELDDILAQFNARKDKDLLLISFLTLLALFMTAGAIILIRRQRIYFEAMARSEREKRGLIEQLEDEKHRAYELASRDHLTGLANRRMFIQLASSHLARARRSRQHYALMFLDLDRFKAINDTLGHKVGDLLLQVVAQRLRETLRESDVLARFGGDEFVILVTGLEQENDILTIVEKLVSSIGKPCTNLDGHDVQVGTSIGIALFPRDGQDLDTLIRHADMAMYQCKKANRGSFAFFDQALNVNITQEFELEQRMAKAIASDEFVLHYQPKIELENYRIVGFEALIRWQSPEHGLIYPNDFIPMAENTGHIIALGNWVIEAACRQLAEWRAEGVPVLPIAINISARQLRDSSLPRRIVGKLAEYGLEPALLQVEVTESSLVENIEIARGILDELVAAGITVALDDFGNGFSSLGYIKTLPISTVKIDRSFVRDIQHNSDDAVIVESTIILAHKLGMRLVAEGVETRDQLVYLKMAGCDEVQGYYFSRPVDHARAREMLLEPISVPT
ncbi:MAG: EAL domain-containing protein [Pseudomonadota bacterium]